MIGALKALGRPIPLSRLALLLSREEAAIRAEIGHLLGCGYVLRFERGAVSLARYPGMVRLCSECGRPLRSTNPDPECVCDPCRTEQRNKAARTAEQMADDARFRLMVIIRLMVCFGDVVDLAAYFETTDRRRIHRMITWWRERGAVIDGVASGGYKIVDWRDASTGAAR